MKTKPKTRGRRVLAAALGFLLVAALLTGFTTVTGNPLAAAFVRSRVMRHLEREYPGYTFAVEEMQKSRPGDFEYIATVAAEGTLDVHFHVTADVWGDVTDDYAYWVPTMRNTRNRLAAEMEGLARQVLAGALPYPVQGCKVEYGYAPDEPDPFPCMPFMEAFVLDMPFDPKAADVPLRLEVTLETEAPGAGTLEQVLPQIRQAVEAQGYAFDVYAVVLVPPGTSYDVSELDAFYSSGDVPAGSIL